MSEKIIAVAYARYSSDNQREESIDAQLRAIHNYAEENGITIIHEYIDRAQSGTNANREDFLQMLNDSKNHEFEMVIVHKLDRFARNRYDSAFSRKKLQDNGVKVFSVLEHFDDSPEGFMMESIAEAMSQYYSMNLAREVRKGLRENALSCRHTGGKPPLGYDVDKNTMKYVINPEEARIVQLIFEEAKNGSGYSDIISKLNSKGWKTKAGKPFGKNSILSILTNEKYKGVYVFNKASPADSNGKRNSHKYKNDDEIIRIPGGIPRIVSDEVFDTVNERLRKRKLKATSRNDAVEVYLLAGKMVCGICGSAYCGNSRTGSGRNKAKKYVSYRCVKRTRGTKLACNNKEVNRDSIEKYVLKMLSDILFNEDRLPKIIEEYNKQIREDSGIETDKKHLKTVIEDSRKKIHNLTMAIAETGSSALFDALKTEESRLNNMEAELSDLERSSNEVKVDEPTIHKAFLQAKLMLESGELPNVKKLINLYVQKITVNYDSIDVQINVLAALKGNSDKQNFTDLDSVSDKAFLLSGNVGRKELK